MLGQFFLLKLLVLVLLSLIDSQNKELGWTFLKPDLYFRKKTSSVNFLLFKKSLKTNLEDGVNQIETKQKF